MDEQSKEKINIDIDEIMAERIKLFFGLYKGFSTGSLFCLQNHGFSAIYDEKNDGFRNQHRTLIQFM